MGSPQRTAWIFERLKDLGKTQAELARHLGLSSPRISEIKRGDRAIALDEIAPLAQFIQMSPENVMAKLSGSTRLGVDSPITVWVTRFVEAGRYYMSHELDEDEKASIKLPYMGIKHMEGVIVRGTSMNRKYPPGTIVICAPVEQLPPERGLVSGDDVVVERECHGEVEATLKELRQHDDGSWWLWPCSTDPQHQEPLEIESPDAIFDDGGAQPIRATAVVVTHLPPPRL